MDAQTITFFSNLLINFVFHVLQMNLDLLLNIFYLWLDIPAKLNGNLVQLNTWAESVCE